MEIQSNVLYTAKPRLCTFGRPLGPKTRLLAYREHERGNTNCGCWKGATAAVNNGIQPGEKTQGNEAEDSRTMNRGRVRSRRMNTGTKNSGQVSQAVTTSRGASIMGD